MANRPFKVQFRFNWQTVGFSEVYWTSQSSLTQAQKAALNVLPYRLALISNKLLVTCYDVRISDPANPGVGTSAVRSGKQGSFADTAVTTLGPWDALLIRWAAATSHRLQEIRGIPANIYTNWSAPIPATGYWADDMNVFLTQLATNSFGIYTGGKPGPLFGISSIVPNDGVIAANLPKGILIVTTNAPHGIPAGGNQVVKLSRVSTLPKLGPKHVALYVTNTTFALKNTDVGQIVYQANSGSCWFPVPTVDKFTGWQGLRGARRAPGAPYGRIVGRRQKKI